MIVIYITIFSSVCKDKCDIDTHVLLFRVIVKQIGTDVIIYIILINDYFTLVVYGLYTIRGVPLVFSF
jgi:hypothetical protein